MEKPERDKILQKIKEIEGSSFRQIAKITGLTVKIEPEGDKQQNRPPVLPVLPVLPPSPCFAPKAEQAALARQLAEIAAEQSRDEPCREAGNLEISREITDRVFVWEEDMRARVRSLVWVWIPGEIIQMN